MFCLFVRQFYPPPAISAIMLAAGDQIEAVFGATLGLSAMAAAGLGNMCSDVVGIQVYMYIYKHMYVCIHVCMYIYIYIYIIHIYIYMYMYIYDIYIYICIARTVDAFFNHP